MRLRGDAARSFIRPRRSLLVATPGALQMDFAAIDYGKKRDQRFSPRVADPFGRG